MLAIYNESKTNWIRANINDKTSKISTSRTLKDNKVRYIDVLLNSVIGTDAIDNCVNMDAETVDCTTLYPEYTSIKFKSKDLKPYITTSDKYNTDVLFINITLNGKIIKNIEGDASIIAYLIAQGELFLIVTINDKAEKTPFKVTLHDSHVVADTTYIFEKHNNQYLVNTTMEQTDTAITKPTFKINRYRPMRPTNLIFSKVGENVKTTLKYPDSHNIVEFTNIEDLLSKIDFIKKDGYKAATLFVNNATFNGFDDETYGKEFETLKGNFKFVNIILTDGKILRK